MAEKLETQKMLQVRSLQKLAKEANPNFNRQTSESFRQYYHEVKDIKESTPIAYDDVNGDDFAYLDERDLTAAESH